MKSIEFGEDGLADLQSVAMELFCDEKDPRSINYQRKLVRPKINWFKTAAFSLIPLVAVFVLFAVMYNKGVQPMVCAGVSLAVLLIYFVIIAKPAVICAVRIYQRYAPETIRNKCRFEPSCSEYMILSIEKYGLIKGMKKGIHRLKRCNLSDGGYDYP